MGAGVGQESGGGGAAAEAACTDVPSAQHQGRPPPSTGTRAPCACDRCWRGRSTRAWRRCPGSPTAPPSRRGTPAPPRCPAASPAPSTGPAAAQRTAAAGRRRAPPLPLLLLLLLPRCRLPPPLPPPGRRRRPPPPPCPARPRRRLPVAPPVAWWGLLPGWGRAGPGPLRGGGWGTGQRRGRAPRPAAFEGDGVGRGDERWATRAGRRVLWSKRWPDERPPLLLPPPPPPLHATPLLLRFAMIAGGALVK